MWREDETVDPGGLRLPGDETGDCFKFTNSLSDMARALGVTFRWGVTVEAIEVAVRAVRDE